MRKKDEIKLLKREVGMLKSDVEFWRHISSRWEETATTYKSLYEKQEKRNARTD
jgi:hypothetical protein